MQNDYTYFPLTKTKYFSPIIGVSRMAFFIGEYKPLLQ